MKESNYISTAAKIDATATITKNNSERNSPDKQHQEKQVDEK